MQRTAATIRRLSQCAFIGMTCSIWVHLSIRVIIGYGEKAMIGIDRSESPFTQKFAAFDVFVSISHFEQPRVATGKCYSAFCIPVYRLQQWPWRFFKLAARILHNAVAGLAFGLTP